MKLKMALFVLTSLLTFTTSAFADTDMSQIDPAIYAYATGQLKDTVQPQQATDNKLSFTIKLMKII